jgi:hypothetical protein
MQDSIKQIIAENTSYKVDDLVYGNVRIAVFTKPEMIFYIWSIHIRRMVYDDICPPKKEKL